MRPPPPGSLINGMVVMPQCLSRSVFPLPPYCSVHLWKLSSPGNCPLLSVFANLFSLRPYPCPADVSLNKNCDRTHIYFLNWKYGLGAYFLLLLGNKKVVSIIFRFLNTKTSENYLSEKISFSNILLIQVDAPVLPLTWIPDLGCRTCTT